MPRIFIWQIIMQAIYGRDKRWELLHVSVKDECFVVLDNLAKKRRIYHVPHLRHVELIQHAVYVCTATEKVMRLDLLTAMRQFLTAEQFKSIVHVNLAQQIQKRSAKKTQQAFANIANMAPPQFLNTEFLNALRA
jgi:hypothetical protein